MVYASVTCGYAHSRIDLFGDIVLYVLHNGLQSEIFLYMYGYDQEAFNTNSNNMWFPMPAC